MNLFDELRPWTEVVLEQVPGLELFDAHTHLGQNDPDGMKQTAEELVLARARSARALRRSRSTSPTATGPRTTSARRGARLGRAARPVLPRQPARRPDPEAERSLAAGARDQAPSARRAVHARPRGGPLDRGARQRALAAGPDPRRPRDPGARPACRRARRGVPGGPADPGPRRHLRPLLDLARAADLPNLLFDTAWWIPADLDGAVLAGAARADPVRKRRAVRQHVISAAFQLRWALQPGSPPTRSLDRLRAVAADRRRRAAQPAGPAIGERERARICCSTASRTSCCSARSARCAAATRPRCSRWRGSRATCPRRSTTRRCSRRSARCSTATRRYAAEHPDERRRLTFLILAATVAKTPGRPDSRRRGCRRAVPLPDQPQPGQRQQVVDLVDRLADERHERARRGRRWRSRACSAPSSARSRRTIPST